MMTKWLLLSCAIALLALRIGTVDATNPVSATICGLEGFQFDTLRQPEYWSITVQKTICLLPPGYVEAEVTSCTIYFSVCQALPANKCGGVKNSSTCQEVATNDTQTHYFSIGDHSENAAYSTLDDKHTSGFVTLRKAQVESCNGTIGTFISWECDESKTWDPSVHDVTQYLKSAVPVVSDCLLSIDLLYNGACYVAPTLAPDTCKISPYDVMGLVKHDYWFANPPLDGCPLEASTGCTIFFSFCQALPETIDPRCFGSAVCVVDTTADGESTAFSLGQFRSYNVFIENDDDVGGGFHIDAENGSNCSVNSTYGFRSRIILSCNSTVEWNDNQDLTDIIHVAYLSASYPCEYNINLPYAGACEPVGPIVNVAHASFVGWILLGLFFFVVIVYFSVGAGYQYLAKGARGIEVIPNYGFWYTFVMLVLEGCKFSLDVITCFQFDGTIKNRLSSRVISTGGVDYDKI